MIARNVLPIALALWIGGCSDRNLEDAGRVDDWTWDDPKLKTRTSPSKEKRARADLVDGQIELKFGEAYDHPVDIMIHHTEMIPEPEGGEWDMKWLNENRFVFEHSELRKKSWKVDGVVPMTVTVIAEWTRPPNP